MKYIKSFYESDNSYDIKKVQYSGFTVLYGRDHISNHYLTFEIAKENDMWLHVKDGKGSHVVIKIDENLPTEDVIKYAATIAKSNSDAYGKEIEVYYCKKKFIRRDVGMKEGEVLIDLKNTQIIKLNN